MTTQYPEYTYPSGPYETPLPPAEPVPPRYGEVGPVPWTLAQTLLGAAATLVPWVAILVLSQLATGTTSQTHALPRWEDVIGAIASLVLSVVVEGAFLLAPAYYTVLRRNPGVSIREGLRALGYRKTALWPAVGLVAAAFVVVLIVSFGYGELITVFHLPLQTNADVLANEARFAPLTTIATLAGAVFVAPFCEETFFRGYLFGGLLHGMSLWPAALLSAFLFAVAHGDIGSFVVLFAIGFVLAVVRWRTGSLWPGMVVHGLNNALAAVTILAVIVH